MQTERKAHMIFEVLKEVQIYIAFFRVMTPYNLVAGHQRF
jgi:hypothetical protein